MGLVNFCWLTNKASQEQANKQNWPISGERYLQNIIFSRQSQVKLESHVYYCAFLYQSKKTETRYNFTRKTPPTQIYTHVTQLKRRLENHLHATNLRHLREEGCLHLGILDKTADPIRYDHALRHHLELIVNLLFLSNIHSNKI